MLLTLGGGAMYLGVIRGRCVPRRTLGSLFVYGRSCVPTLLIVWPGASQPFWMVQDSSKMAGDLTLMNIPRTTAYNVLPPDKPWQPLLSQDILQDIWVSLTQILMESQFYSGTQFM